MEINALATMKNYPKSISREHRDLMECCCEVFILSKKSLLIDGAKHQLRELKIKN
jgi:hypothetical protein